MPPSVSSTPMGEASYDTTSDDVAKGNDSQECDEVSIKPAKNGGFVATARYKPKGDGKSQRYVEPDTFAFQDAAGLVQFLTQQFGGSDVAAEAAPPPMPPPDQQVPVQ